MGHGLIGAYQFMSGAAMLGAWVGGSFFFKFWSKTRDRLFYWFGVAFWLLGVERVILAVLVDPSSEDHSLVYLLRLAAFTLLLWAIADKNRDGTGGV